MIQIGGISDKNNDDVVLNTRFIPIEIKHLCKFNQPNENWKKSEKCR